MNEDLLDKWGQGISCRVLRLTKQNSELSNNLDYVASILSVGSVAHCLQ